MKTRVVAITEQGPQDITDEIAQLYDAIVGSLDWGSGFLDIDQVRAVLQIAKLCGYEVHEPLGTYWGDQERAAIEAAQEVVP